MSGFVYVMKMGGAVKIGTSRKPNIRMHHLSGRFGRDINESYVSRKFENPFAVEKAVHNKLAEFRINGEWFLMSFDDAVNCIDECPSTADVPAAFVSVKVRGSAAVLLREISSKRKFERHPVRSQEDIVDQLIKQAHKKEIK